MEFWLFQYSLGERQFTGLFRFNLPQMICPQYQTYIKVAGSVAVPVPGNRPRRQPGRRLPERDPRSGKPPRRSSAPPRRSPEPPRTRSPLINTPASRRPSTRSSAMISNTALPSTWNNHLEIDQTWCLFKSKCFREREDTDELRFGMCFGELSIDRFQRDRQRSARSAYQHSCRAFL